MSTTRRQHGEKTPSRPLRILFVSSTTTGGSGRSQRELNTQLRRFGAETLMLVDNAVGATATRFLHEQLWGASVRFENTPVIGDSARRLRALPGRTPQRTDGDVLVTPAPENAFPDLAISFKPDVVVGSSITRPAWREIRSACDELAIPTVLYLREKTALRHLESTNGRHAAVVGNSHTLVKDAADLYSTDAALIPSVVDVSAAEVRSTRERVLLVNPRVDHGVDVVDDLAPEFRTIEFVLQESWPLDSAEKEHVDRILSRHSNVTFRPQTDSPAAVFRDAAVVLAPHQMDNRPQTILEALGNGIPVIANDLPGLVEAVGPGGIIISRRAGWVDALQTLWQDPVTYRSYEAAARAHANRPEVKTETIVSDFVEVIKNAIRTYRQEIAA